MKKAKNKYIKYLPILGCISTGLIYTAIGISALLSLLRLKEGSASKNSLLAYVQDWPGGEIVIWAILLGMLCYIVSMIPFVIPIIMARAGKDLPVVPGSASALLPMRLSLTRRW